jgi:hypothetical protein
MTKKVKNSEVRYILTVADRFLFIALLILCVGSFWAVKSLRPQGKEVIIEFQSNIIYQGSLFTDKHLEVTGQIGITTVEIENAEVWVSHSDCPHQICVKTGKIDRAGDIIVCIPNKVVVRVKKRGQSIYDAITG